VTVQEKAAETLTGLGLTSLQAKVYLALIKEGKSTIKKIAKTSKIARQDLYRISTQLLNLGLVEKLVDTPTKYEAIPVKDVINMLVERRREETAHLMKDSNEFLRFYEENKEISPKEEETQFVIINDLQARLKKAKKLISNSEKSINIVTKWAFFLTYTLETIEEHITAMNNGAKIKIVTQEPDNIGSLPKNIQKLMKHLNFEMRHISSLPSSIVAIFDRKEVNILLATDKSPIETPLLMTNNTVLVELAQNYFETVWNNTSRQINKET
jgi:sugar-specific transcriptional regulator TrmB